MHSKLTLASMCENVAVRRNCLDRCIDGYYGNPSSGQACRPCPCPDVPTSNQYFAHSCFQNPWSSDVICNCLQGHAGMQARSWWLFSISSTLLSEKESHINNLSA